MSLRTAAGGVTDTLGWLPNVTSVRYLNVFAEIRAVDKGLPPAEQIHVWLGEPPVDWSKIRNSEDLPQFTQRDRHPAELIKLEILAKHKKASVIYGGLHFLEIDKMQPRGNLPAVVFCCRALPRSRTGI